MGFFKKIGNCQISGDFSKLEKLVKELKSKYYVDVGILGQETDTESGLTIAGIGAVHEFGTDRAGRGNKTKIPKRSFIVMPIETKQSNIQSDVERRAEAHLGNGDVKGIFKDIGVSAEAQIQKAFDTGGFGKWAPNAESTIARKGSDSPLIDRGMQGLRGTITSEVGK